MEGNGKSIHITGKKTDVSLDPVTGRLRISHSGVKWEWAADYEPGFCTAEGNRLHFSDALEQEHIRRETGLGQEIVSRYSRFPGEKEISFETRIWLEEASEALHLEFLPVTGKERMARVCWPGPMAFDEARADWADASAPAAGAFDSQ